MEKEMERVGSIVLETFKEMENLAPPIIQTATDGVCDYCGKVIPNYKEWQFRKELDFHGKKYFNICSPCYHEIKDASDKKHAESMGRIYARQNTPDKMKERGVPKLFMNCTFDNYIIKDESQKKAVDYLKKFTGFESIFLWSENPGTGKTHLSAALLRKMLRKGLRCGFVSAPQILLELRGSFKDTAADSEEEIIDKYSEIPFLVIDDIGAEKSTDYSIQSWYIIIDRRYSSMKPTIFTSNLSLNTIAEKLNERISSRLGCGKVIKLESKDYRINK